MTIPRDLKAVSFKTKTQNTKYFLTNTPNYDLGLSTIMKNLKLELSDNKKSIPDLNA